MRTWMHLEQYPDLALWQEAPASSVLLTPMWFDMFRIAAHYLLEPTLLTIRYTLHVSNGIFLLSRTAHHLILHIMMFLQ